MPRRRGGNGQHPQYSLSPGPPQESFNSPIDRRADYYRLTALQNLRNKGSAAVRPFNNIPNALTLSRVLMVPLFVAAWFSKADAAPALAATIFILASLTGEFAAVGVRGSCRTHG